MSRLYSVSGDDEQSLPDIEEIKVFYDTVYHVEAGHEPDLHRHYSRLFERLELVAGQLVLDVACGAGGWLRLCENRGLDVTGVDLSENAIAVCKKTMPKGEFIAQPAETLPFQDASFDVITCLGSLEHFVDPVGSLKEMVRVARTDAAFAILVPNKDFLTRKLGLYGGTYQVDAKEVVRTLDEWESLFNAAGLEVTHRWKDLHVLNTAWITSGAFYTWPFRALQALMLPLWPLKWQYQVYHQCVKR
jgi:ubiquinone/menaquinone biosynthesis C-methylase UbiE